MPSMILNMDALRWNLAQMPHLEQEWNFTFMPVLKMVACHPAVVEAARQAGYAVMARRKWMRLCSGRTEKNILLRLVRERGRY